MSLSVSSIWHRFRIGGTQQDLTGEVQQTEQLEAWTTMVADVELYDHPALVQGSEVDIWQVDLEGLTVAPQFGGYLNKVRGTANPNVVKLQLQGPCHRFRRATQNGLDLTGMTDGEAWMAIADACNVPYDPADITDTGYVLGAQTDVFWRRDMDGWQMIRELDQVFGMATIEIEDGRVIRFAYDRVPADANITRTFTGGVDADFYDLEREYWGLDEIQNKWEVRGASWKDADNCTLTPWAKADGPNAAFDTVNVRVSGQTFSSDLIQDEALAEAIVRRMMRWWNREPNLATVITENDPSIHPGHVIGLNEETSYGMNLDESAATNPFLVLTVDRKGDLMTLNCVGGAAGDQGTVTTGVERRCNKTSGDLDLPGLYTPPLVTVPPLYVPDPYVCLSFGGPGGVCPDDEGGGGGTPVSVTWENDVGGDDFTIFGNDVRAEELLNPVARTVETVSAFSPGVPKSFTAEWIFRVQNSGILGDNIEILGEDASDPNSYCFWLSFFQNATGAYWLNGADYEGYGSGTGHNFYSPAPSGVDIPVVVDWDRPSETFTVSVFGGTGSPITEVVSVASGVPLAMATGEVRFVAIANNGSSGDYSEVRDFIFTENE